MDNDEGTSLLHLMTAVIAPKLSATFAVVHWLALRNAVLDRDP